jgi:hypothetical protein
LWSDKAEHGKTQSFQNKFWFVNLVLLFVADHTPAAFLEDPVDQISLAEPQRAKSHTSKGSARSDLNRLQLRAEETESFFARPTLFSLLETKGLAR